MRDGSARAGEIRVGIRFGAALRRSAPLVAMAALTVAPPVASAAPAQVDAKLKAADAPAGDLRQAAATSIPGGGTVYRFQQEVAGIPVIGGETVVSDPPGAPPSIVVDGSEHGIGRSSPPRVTGVRAISTARGAAVVERTRGQSSARLAIDPTGRDRLVWRVEVPSARPLGDFEVLVDAHSGSVLRTQDLLRDFRSGRAKLFDPNPIVERGGFEKLRSDRGDRDTRLLTRLRRRVTLRKIKGGQHCLRGAWATAKLGHDARGVCRRSLRWKRVKRSANAFEALMVYYHVTRAQRYVQSLGFSDSNHPENGIDDRSQIAVADAFRADNSFYSPFTRRIKYGSGGVDDAEDADVILHEYAHALQDGSSHAFLVSGGFDAGSIAEGSADYWAAAMSSRSPRTGNEDDVCIFDWDAATYGRLSPAGGRLCGRRADDDRTFAQAENPNRICSFDIHCVGQVWSSALWDLRRDLGGRKMDTIYLTAQLMYKRDETFEQATKALVAADLALNGGANKAAICAELQDERGLTVGGCS